MRPGNINARRNPRLLRPVSPKPAGPKIAGIILSRMTYRHWKAKLGHYLLLVGIVAVGVGAFNGIRQASRSASANFGLFNQAVSGRSDFLIESPSQRLGPERSRRRRAPARSRPMNRISSQNIYYRSYTSGSDCSDLQKSDSLLHYSSIAGADNPENKTAGPSRFRDNFGVTE